jgi:hypothetical protein
MSYFIVFGALGLCTLVIFFPFKVSCEKYRIFINGGRDDYDVEVLDFRTDYERSNPVISKKGWKNWLQMIESNV